MKAFSFFVFSAYFMFKNLGYSNPRSFASIIWTIILGILSLNLILVVKEVFSLSGVFVLSIIPLVIFLEKLLEKYFTRAYKSNFKAFKHLEARKLQNIVIVISCFVISFLTVVITVGVLKSYN